MIKNNQKEPQLKQIEKEANLFERLCLGVNLSPNILFSPHFSSPIPESHKNHSYSHTIHRTTIITKLQKIHHPT